MEGEDTAANVCSQPYSDKVIISLHSKYNHHANLQRRQTHFRIIPHIFEDMLKQKDNQAKDRLTSGGGREESGHADQDEQGDDGKARRRHLRGFLIQSTAMRFRVLVVLLVRLREKQSVKAMENFQPNSARKITEV